MSNNKDLKKLEAILAMQKHDLEILNEIIALNQAEQEVLAELDENEAKIAELLDHPSKENQLTVLNYLQSLLN